MCFHFTLRVSFVTHCDTEKPVRRCFLTVACVYVCAGLKPGLMKLFGEGGTPKPFVRNGELKSSISSLRSIPVELDMTLEPKLQVNNLI